MFMFHVAVALGLMALAAGIFLYSWASCKVDGGTCLAKLFGFIIIVIASLSTICTLYCGFMLFSEGHFFHGGTCMDHNKMEPTTIANKVIMEKNKK